jgi:hypothetical protein
MTRSNTATTSLPEPVSKMDRGTGTNTSPGSFLARIVLGAVMATTGPEGYLPFWISRFRSWGRVAQSSTLADEQVDPALSREVRKLFDDGAREFFRDGMESNFSWALLELLHDHGQRAVTAIAGYLLSGSAKPDVASEALRWISDIDDQATFLQRWDLLQHSLHNESARVRDGAILAFANMNDPRASKILAEARTLEPVAELRKLIDQVIRQLEHAQ